ncbi:molybdenum ABC transporter ATP-binding protein ModC [Aliivibrio fischeri]|uniref:molybdenum ABC transporter ATP-binding protein ModC n=1 Tax=Aliivibrio fischeri TaxID=668 RepID=UPI0012D9B591|nr:molybdenum ABC transporter ATP-binding protein ModC [Aliivibrio fischeri]MUK28526.1 molybdenum ABC transporter ATP-binding protein ModC [Aliivibrio fischeri]
MLVIDIKKQLGDLLLDVKLSLPSSGISAIFGRSGAGKSSLANVISGLTSPEEGRITLNNRVLFDSESKVSMPPEKRNIGYVFQDARLFPHYKVEGNLLYGCGGKRTPHFNDVVKLLDIESLLARYPHSLSGGEKQRVAIGRAILSEPALLIMDEPLASLDLPRKHEVMPYLERLAKEIKIPILYVSHSLDEILRLADNMVLLNQGSVSLSGDITSVWSSPLMRPWLNASEHSALLEGMISELHSDHPMTKVTLNNSQQGIWVKSPCDCVEEGKKIRLRIRANDVSLIKQQPQHSSIRNILPVVIEDLSEDKENDVVAVKLNLSGHVLWANITLWARDELQLGIGQSWFAQIKGVSVTQSDLCSK